MAFVLPFEKPIADLIGRVRELRAVAVLRGPEGLDDDGDDPIEAELKALEGRAKDLAKEIFADLTPWQKVQLSRHPARPYTLDYVSRLITDFTELAGDRRFAEDESLIAGLGRFEGRPVAVLGHQKGRGAKDNVRRNFGMPHPEGYRKALRIYELADRFRLPILTFIDTPGAYPGIGAEERGQSEAIGACLAAMARAGVPIIATIIGEGGSGGALALGVANEVFVLEYGTYSVITPEGCASILWKDGSKADRAAAQMRMTADELFGLGVVDGVVEEPAGGAHHDIDATADAIRATLRGSLDRLANLTPHALADHRYARFRRLGTFVDSAV
jgi:acetyl-CoA carboxylase carboxyl transferase subunit alpha